MNYKYIISRLGIKTQFQVKDLKIDSFDKIILFFDTLKIASLALKVEKEHFANISLPAIAQVRTNDGLDFVFLEKLEKGNLQFNDGASKTEPLEVFLENFTGHILLLAADEFSGAAENQENANAYFLLGTLSMLSLAGFILLKSNFLIWHILHFVGLGISSLLLINHFGQAPPLLKQICSMGSKTDCSAVLSSKYSLAFSGVSWAELSFLYFGYVQVSSLFMGDAAVHAVFVGYSVVLLAPLSLISVYFQWRVLKTWCMLCLGIVAVLWLSAALVFSQGTNMAFSLPALGIMGLWFFIKPSLDAKKTLEASYRDAKSYKEDSTLFKAFLNSQPAISFEPWPNELSNGMTSDICITLVSNPFCKPCAKAHAELEAWARYFEVTLVYRFALHAQDAETIKVVRHLYSLNKAQQAEALSSWYLMANYTTWAAVYPTTTVVSDQELNQMVAWAEDLNVAYTPAVFINGHALKDPYTVYDLKHHLRYLIETA